MNLKERELNFCKIEYPHKQSTTSDFELHDWFEYRLDYTGPEITIKIAGISYLLNDCLQFYYNGKWSQHGPMYEIRLQFADYPIGLTSIEKLKTREEVEIEMIKIMFDINTQLSKHYGVEWNLGPEYYPKRLENLVSEHIFGLDGPIYNQGVL